MRLLCINPNTTEAVTRKVLDAARLAAPDVEIVGATGRFGAAYVASRAAYAVAGHAALDLLVRHGKGADAVLLACFGDPGLDGLKEFAEVPVIGLAEASCHAACLVGRRFGIVTGGERWGTMLQDFVAGQGLSSRLAGVRTVAPTGAEIAADPDAALAALARQCSIAAETDGADAVILAGAGLAGLAGRIADAVPVPVICSVEAGVRLAVAMAGMRLRKPSIGAYAPTPSPLPFASDAPDRQIT
jgi:Asp/Glu/hydantoin racemase